MVRTALLLESRSMYLGGIHDTRNRLWVLWSTKSVVPSRRRSISNAVPFRDISIDEALIPSIPDIDELVECLDGSSCQERQDQSGTHGRIPRVLVASL